MIRVGYEKRDGHMAVTVDGHAETGPKGADIVCAAVSALVQGLIVTLQVLALEHPDAISVAEVDPPMLCTCTGISNLPRCNHCGLVRP